MEECDKNVNQSQSGDEDDGNHDSTELFHDESKDAIEIPSSIDDGT